MSKYEYTADMREISGFGGGYEQTCRNMVVAGLQWFDENPEADPKYKVFKDVYGICIDDNDDAKALDKVLLEAAKNDCTGAMHQACVGHIFYVRKNGWEKYCEEMRKKDDSDHE